MRVIHVPDKQDLIDISEAYASCGYRILRAEKYSEKMQPLCAQFLILVQWRVCARACNNANIILSRYRGTHFKNDKDYGVIFKKTQYALNHNLSRARARLKVTRKKNDKFFYRLIAQSDCASYILFDYMNEIKRL